MLEAGLTVDTYSHHRATPLHWAVWHGNAELMRVILSHKPPLDDTSNDYQGIPADWAVHGSENGWDRKNAVYDEALNLLLKAGVPVPQQVPGTEPVPAVLRRCGVRS
jgi:ankyrin repeat protein